MRGWRYVEALRQAGEEEHRLRQRMRERRRILRNSTELFDDISETAFVKLYRLPQRAVLSIVEEMTMRVVKTWVNGLIVSINYFC